MVDAKERKKLLGGIQRQKKDFAEVDSLVRT